MFRGKMRLAFVMGFVTLYVTMNSHAVPAPAKSDKETGEGRQRAPNLTTVFGSLQRPSFDETSNFLYSKLSSIVPELMEYYSTGKIKKKQFVRRFGIQRKENDVFGYKQFLDRLAGYGVRVESKILALNNVKVRAVFERMTKAVFNTEIERLSSLSDYPLPVQLSDYPYPLFVDTNVTFKGIWKTGFDKSSTAPRPFRLLNGSSKNVTTMHTIGSFEHGRLDELNAQFIELPYHQSTPSDGKKNVKMSMFVILPDENKNNDSATTEKSLENIISLKDLTRLLDSTKKKVEVYLPKFKIQSKFSSIVNQIDRPLHPISLFSGSFEVDDESQPESQSSGTTSDTTESVTPDQGTQTVAPEVTQFNVDRPFVALVVTKGNIFTDILSAYVVDPRAFELIQ